MYYFTKHFTKKWILGIILYSKEFIFFIVAIKRLKNTVFTTVYLILQGEQMDMLGSITYIMLIQ